MSSLNDFKDFEVKKLEMQDVIGGVSINWGAVCGSLYAYSALALFEGSRDASSAAWAAWNNMGCAYY